MATDSARLKFEKVYHWFDTFHNTEPERHPGKTGCCLTLLMVPAVLIYGIVWFVQHQQKPPVETLVIDWSISYGPYPMKVSCHEGASCWLYLSGCESESSGRCISLAAGQELELQMCYSLAAREGLHAWWTGSNSSGISIYSQAKSMWMKQAIEVGRSSMTYVKTEDKTKESGEWERLRHEWFTMYLSSEALAPEHSGCQEHRSGAYAAQIVMKPEFYEKTLEKLDFIVSLIGEVGGAYGIISTIFFALYILLWNVENANKQRHDQSLPVTAPAPAMEPGREITTTPKAEVAPPPPTRSATDDMMVEHTKEAIV